ncbi:MAG TPA: undecaprenyl-diphosphate phosphatase [Acidimicrobiales bacterium]|nr:undecaprenyl-diphosphate phosphatase [Acidimicrobiales bacterium]
MHIWQSIILGVVEGVTEFLPVSSTGHLTVVEKLMGMKVNNDSVTAYTAVIQVGAIIAALWYFRRDIVAIVEGWFGGLRQRERRGELHYRMGWLIIVGTIPIAIVGLAAKGVIEGPLRNLWWVVAALIAWGAAMVWSESSARQTRGEPSLTVIDGLVIGVAQCLALIPGVSRSGATIAAGLFRGIDRVTATRLSFFLAIPALVAAAGLEAPKAFKHGGVGAAPTVVGIVVSFAVAYAAIAWFLRFVGHHRIDTFVPYRVIAALVVIGLLLSHTITSI